MGAAAAPEHKPAEHCWLLHPPQVFSFMASSDSAQAQWVACERESLSAVPLWILSLMTRTIECKMYFQLGSDLLHEVAVGKIITNTKTNIRMSNS